MPVCICSYVVLFWYFVSVPVDYVFCTCFVFVRYFVSLPIDYVVCMHFVCFGYFVSLPVDYVLCMYVVFSLVRCVSPCWLCILYLLYVLGTLLNSLWIMHFVFILYLCGVLFHSLLTMYFVYFLYFNCFLVFRPVPAVAGHGATVHVS